MLKKLGAKELSFSKNEAQERVKESALLKLETPIDWNRVSREMGNLGRSGYGPRGYDPLKL